MTAPELARNKLLNERIGRDGKLHLDRQDRRLLARTDADIWERLSKHEQKLARRAQRAGHGRRFMAWDMGAPGGDEVVVVVARIKDGQVNVEDTRYGDEARALIDCATAPKDRVPLEQVIDPGLFDLKPHHLGGEK
jgi:hypothetical protein